MKLIQLYILLLFIFILSSCDQSTSPPEKININTAAEILNNPTKTWNERELIQLKKGKQLYRTYCSACHLSSGEGQLQTIGSPALKNNRIIKRKIEALIITIFNGRNSMPAFHNSINNNDLANIVSYIRNTLGNNLNNTVEKSIIDSLRPESD